MSSNAALLRYSDEEKHPLQTVLEQRPGNTVNQPNEAQYTATGNSLAKTQQTKHLMVKLTLGYTNNNS